MLISHRGLFNSRTSSSIFQFRVVQATAAIAAMTAYIIQTRTLVNRERSTQRMGRTVK
jgi:hypothetical protein